MYSNVTTSLPSNLVAYINEKAQNDMSSKSDVVRQAIALMRENDFWNEIKTAREEYKQGKYFDGDLETALAQYNKLHAD